MTADKAERALSEKSDFMFLKIGLYATMLLGFGLLVALRTNTNSNTFHYTPIMNTQVVRIVDVVLAVLLIAVFLRGTRGASLTLRIPALVVLLVLEYEMAVFNTHNDVTDGIWWLTMLACLFILPPLEFYAGRHIHRS